MSYIILRIFTSSPRHSRLVYVGLVHTTAMTNSSFIASQQRPFSQAAVPARSREGNPAGAPQLADNSTSQGAHAGSDKFHENRCVAAGVAMASKRPRLS